MKKIFIIFLFLVFAFFAFTLNLKNPDSILVRYYGDLEWQVPLFLVLMLPFFIGAILGVLVMSFSLVKSKMRVGKAKRELAKVEGEVQNLRAMPIKDEV